MAIMGQYYTSIRDCAILYCCIDIYFTEFAASHEGLEQMSSVTIECDHCNRHVYITTHSEYIIHNDCYSIV